MTLLCPPNATPEQLADLGTANLERIIAIDSQSDERNDAIPSTEGQRHLCDSLALFFGELGYQTKLDDSANLLVEIPAAKGCEAAPKLAMLAHIDTSRGTEAVSQLQTLSAWDGSRVPYPENDRLQVTVESFPETRDYVGEDLLFGPGKFPIGLDDKLGMSEMMTLAQVLARESEIPHGEILLVFRPDEEIGRMAAVEGLADELSRRGIRFGYTIDGIGPYEVQVENFDASRAMVQITGRPITEPVGASIRTLSLRIAGCKSHGATAKAEGYLNATVILARAWKALASRGDIVPIDFQSDIKSEVNADARFMFVAKDAGDLQEAERALTSALEKLVEPHGWRGAHLIIGQRQDGAPSEPTDEIRRTFDFLVQFLDSNGPEPMLSEDSEERQGYSNPYFVDHGPGNARLEFRLRAFDRGELDAREAHVTSLCEAAGDAISLEIEQQYANMGPSLAPHPELVQWATDAAKASGIESRCYPIRGGTGVDPFLAKNIPIANLGTGYFAPESEKEFTSRQKIAQHSAWLIHLVQRVAL